MSRIGKQPIPVPSGVDVKIDGSTVTVKGPKGELKQTFSEISPSNSRTLPSSSPVPTTPAKRGRCTG